MGNDTAVNAMIAVRILITAVALAAGILMIKYPTVESSLRINAAVALINPTLFSLVNIIGLSAMAGEAPAHKILLILAGSILIIIGTTKPGETFMREKQENNPAVKQGDKKL